MRKLLIILLLLSGFGYASDSTITDTTLQHDAYLMAGAPAANTGTSTYMRQGYYYSNCGTPEMRQVYWVTKPTNLIVADSLLIILTSSETPTASTEDTIDIFWLEQDISGQEGTITWNTYDGSNAWTAGGGDFQADILGTFPFTDVTAAAGNVCTLVVKGAVFDSIMLGTKANNGYIFKSRSEDNLTCGVDDFNSIFTTRTKEYATPAAFPKFVYMGADTMAVDTLIGTDQVEDAEMSGAFGDNDKNYGDSTLTRLLYNGFAPIYSLIKTVGIGGTIPSGATIIACTLSINITSVANTGGVISAYQVFKPWNEGALKGTNPADAPFGEGVATYYDWSNDGEEWASSGCQNARDTGHDNNDDHANSDRMATAEGSTSSVNSSGQKKIVISAELAQAWYDGTTAENGVLLMYSNSDGDCVIYNSESGTSPPYFIVAYTLPVEASTGQDPMVFHGPGYLRPIHGPGTLTPRVSP